jgi:predicted Rossmann fold nucleotide-binding protein DprA/Smf involved in DNA uptake
LGSNRLIADGAAPAISAADVLELLQIGAAPGAVAFAHAAHAALHPDVLELFGSEPLSFDTLAERSPLDSGQLALAIEELVEAGLIERRGFFYERVSPSGSSRGHRVAET